MLSFFHRGAFPPLLLATVLSAGAVAALACQASPSPRAAPGATPLGRPAPAASAGAGSPSAAKPGAVNGIEAKTIIDAALSKAVAERLTVYGGANFKAVSVRARGGRVELDGRVSNLPDVYRAEAVVRRIYGVKKISNHLEVKPAPASDEQIRTNVHTLLRLDEVAGNLTLNVEVTKQSVKISGGVDSWQERRLSVELARAAAGARAVDDSGVRVAQPDKSAERIHSEVIRRLHNDLRVDARSIEVRIDQGVARLNGNVGSLAEAFRAERDAHVKGVRSVRAELAIVPKKPGLLPEWLRKREPEKLELAVVEALSYEPRLEGASVSVAVPKAGVVTLDGPVGTIAARRAAVRRARNVTGVSKVIDRLVTRPPQRARDDVLLAQIRRLLRSDSRVEARRIRVSVFEGRAYLSGEVANSYQRRMARRTVARVGGVRAMKDELELSVPQYPAADKAATERLERLLRWDADIDSTHLAVHFRDGAVILRGRVAGWRQYDAVVENARAMSPRAIVDELTVGPKS